MIQFFETVTGKRFFEGDFPKMVKQLSRIADSLEKLAETKKCKIDFSQWSDERLSNYLEGAAIRLIECSNRHGDDIRLYSISNFDSERQITADIGIDAEITAPVIFSIKDNILNAESSDGTDWLAINQSTLLTEEDVEYIRYGWM